MKKKRLSGSLVKEGLDLALRIMERRLEGDHMPLLLHDTGNNNLFLAQAVSAT